MNTRYKENQTHRNNKYVQAFLNMISKAEGTNGDYHLLVYGKVISSPFFPSLIGKVGTKASPVRIPSLDKYPKMLVTVRKGLNSSAVGKYQIIRKTYEGNANALGITDFSELSQDIIAINLIRQRGALPYILKGDISGALTKSTVNKEWASFAGAGYGQGEKSLTQLITWFNQGMNGTLGLVSDNANSIVLAVAFGVGLFFLFKK